MFEVIIACQMNSIEYGVMLDLNLKGYTFFDTHCVASTALKPVFHFNRIVAKPQCISLFPEHSSGTNDFYTKEKCYDTLRYG